GDGYLLRLLQRIVGLFLLCLGLVANHNLPDGTNTPRRHHSQLTNAQRSIRSGGHLQLYLVESGGHLGLFIRFGPSVLRHNNLTSNALPFNQHFVSAVVVVQSVERNLSGGSPLESARVQAVQKGVRGLSLSG